MTSGMVSDRRKTSVVVKAAGEGTVVLSCTCKHTFQDQRYGVGKRLHNRCLDGKARCTVCGTVRDA